MAWEGGMLGWEGAESHAGTGSGTGPGWTGLADEPPILCEMRGAGGVMAQGASDGTASQAYTEHGQLPG